MPPTKRTLLLALAAGTATVLLAASIVTSLIASPPRHRAGAPQPRGIRLAVGSLVDRPVPDIALTDERGRRVSLASFRGRYLILAPSMTLCHEVCPMTAAVLGEIQAAVRRDGLARRVAVAEATVDPWRDSPARLRAYRRLIGARFETLTGSPAQIRRLWRFFGVYYGRVPQDDPPDRDWLTHRVETFDVQHTDALLIVDPGGRWRVAVLGMPSTGGTLPAKLRRLLNDQGRRNLRHPDQPWTAKQALDDLFALRGDSASPRAGALRRGRRAALRARLAAVRGRPVVVNEWASWCLPCRTEFPLLQRAAARLRGRVAFVGIDVNDNAAQARAFLARHPVGYPSYADPTGRLARSFGSTAGIPTTLYLDAHGRKVHVHVGYYATQRALDADLGRYAPIP